MFSQSYKSPNFDKRVPGVPPSMIILHYTGMQSAEAALERLCNPDSKVSAHYLIDEEGQIFQLVSDESRAWHAGVSCWNGIEDINARSIGIELVNPGHEFGYRAFPAQQIAVLITLCKDLIANHNIAPANILAHSDIAPSRKQDPGELFPWEGLAQQGIGLWPTPQEMDIQAAADIVQNPAALEELLGVFGYYISNNNRDVIVAFHRHFYPEKFTDGQNPEQPDIQTVAKLLSLLRLRHETC